MTCSRRQLSGRPLHTDSTSLPTRRRLLGGLALAATAAATGGCAFAIPPTLPRMDVLRLPGPCPAPSTAASTLLVLLPGAYSRPPEFIEAGFVEALRAQRTAADICIVDAHLGYYTDKSIVRRLRDEVVLPARAQGTRHVWLVGISLGGFGALGYAVRHGAEIDGVLALAPYLGPRRLMQEIAQAGGPAGWHAATPAPAPGGDDLDRELWHAFAGPAAAQPLPPVHLGYGRDDRFADAHRVFAGLLPAARVASTPGGHDWPAWSALWQDWLARGPLQPACAAA